MMYLKLKCPVCGFAFGVATPDDISEEEKAEIMECPCGAMCEETEELHANVWEPPKEEARITVTCTKCPCKGACDELPEDMSCEDVLAYYAIEPPKEEA